MHKIVLFDGECTVCDASVQFIMKRDKEATFQFASLQSKVGQRLLKEWNIPTDVESIVLIEEKRYMMKSTAALNIARQLNGLWKLGYMAILIPRPFRDGVYNYIARNRYKWFGEKSMCQLPTAEEWKRFIE